MAPIKEVQKVDISVEDLRRNVLIPTFNDQCWESSPGRLGNVGIYLAMVGPRRRRGSRVHVGAGGYRTIVPR